MPGVMEIWFQSLFLWMTLVGNCDTCKGKGWIKFQSLFLWMTLVGFLLEAQSEA